MTVSLTKIYISETSLLRARLSLSCDIKEDVSLPPEQIW